MITIYSGSRAVLGNRNKSAFAMAMAAGRLASILVPNKLYLGTKMVAKLSLAGKGVPKPSLRTRKGVPTSVILRERSDRRISVSTRSFASLRMTKKRL